MPFVQFKSKQIFYQSTGKDCPVVLLHGFCEDHTMWQDFTKEWFHQTITIDLPGFGKSELLEENSMEAYAALVELVLNELEIDKCVLIGHSMGGYVSLAFAEQYPDRLMGMGMIHSHPFGDSDAKKANREKSIEFIDRNGTILYVKQLIPQLFAPNFVGSNDFLIHKLIFEASKYASNSIQANLKAMMKRPDRTAVLKNITCPVLFIIGKLDQVIDYEKSCAQITMPQIADIHILARVGHMGTYEATKQTQKITQEFIAFCKTKN